MTEEEEVSRGAEAQALLANPLLQEAFQTIASRIEGSWRNSPANDRDGRERLWTMLKLLERVHEHLESVVNSGKMAEASLKERAKAAIGLSSRTL